VKVVGVPVVTWPNTSAAGIFVGVVAALVKAAVALEKYPTRVTAVRAPLKTQEVVMATGVDPVATPPLTKGIVTALGVAATVSDSVSVALRATVAVLEFN
jgi:hypothetical protein